MTLDRICDWHSIAIETRDREIRQYGKQLTTCYDKVGCLDCSGNNYKCPRYFSNDRLFVSTRREE